MTGSTESAAPYRVLARKYRPSRFADLVGQDAMVRTLTNAINSGRLAHAFILTGIRGVGKTTTARIIARALNCIGADGQGGPTPDPCGVCENCIAIGEDRHVDVIEMDAASRTGVDDIRELIEGVLYRPVSARFKIYIIDEVHMLSRNAFNALLKTLEEPPEHVKFIFATTETRRVPVTVLSRCQRFDLRRVDGESLMGHLRSVAEHESVEIATDALRQIVRAAEGSVRDALSLLDQAIAHADSGAIEAERVREMLGLADRMRTTDLFEALMHGNIAEALSIFDSLYEAGADPTVVLQDLLEFSHWLTRLKAVPDTGAATGADGATMGGGAVSDVEHARGRALADGLTVPVLSRAWQILLKGLSEARVAHDTRQAAEMLLIRLAYAADMPTPAELIRSIKAGAGTGAEPAAQPPPQVEAEPTAEPAPQPVIQPEPERLAQPQPSAQPAAQPQPLAQPEPSAQPLAQPQTEAKVSAMPSDFEALVALFGEQREQVLRANLTGNVHLVAYEPGRLAYRAGPNAPAGLAGDIRRRLESWTGQSWSVEAVEAQEAAPSLYEQQVQAAAEERAVAIAHPSVQAALKAFPGATVEDIRTVETTSILDDEPVDPPTDPDEEPENGDAHP